MKRCNMCKELKSYRDYWAFPRNTDGYQSNCKSCGRIANKEWYKKNRETRHYEYREKTYGLAKEEVDALLEGQNGRCAACFNLPTQRGLVVDHDHKTGAVRALLCHNCNSSLGYLKDDPIRLKLLLDYILKFEGEE